MTTAKPTIALIEDDSVLADMYIKKFAIDGYTIDHATDGEAGLELVKKVRPDIVLIDIMMPKKNGLDMLREMKEDAAHDAAHGESAHA